MVQVLPSQEMVAVVLVPSALQMSVAALAVAQVFELPSRSEVIVILWKVPYPIVPWKASQLEHWLPEEESTPLGM
jgi:hypothetical protein